MIVLGIETSTRLGSVGVVEAPDEGGHRPTRVLAEATRDSGLAHGTFLLGLIDEALGLGGCDLSGVDVIAVSIGPGSFTGLRVALATAKGLVLGTTTRLVGVPTLTALAEAALARLGTAPGPPPSAGAVIAPCLDARRGEVYGACFSVPAALASGTTGPLPEIEPAGAFAPAEFARRVTSCAAGGVAFVLGDGASRHRGSIDEALGGAAVLLDDELGRPSGATVAAIGARGGGSPGDAAGLAPIYVRASEAERNREAVLAPGGERPGSR